MPPNRRDILKTTSAIGVSGLTTSLAGCTGDPNEAGQPTATATELATEPPTETSMATETATATPDPARVAGDPTVALSTHPDLGVILTDSEGMTLYLFTQDEGGESACYGECAQAWPPLVVEDEADLSAPDGLPGTLDTTERDDGSLQVTYDGTPLYYFVQDEAPGDANGQGVGGVWFVLRPAAQAISPTVRVREHASHGRILTDSEGMTLYRFTRDNEGESVCYDDCADAWPPLVVEDRPVAPASLRGALGTTEREDGSLQVTYNGMPLYYFVQDEEPGDAKGQGVSDAWFVIEPEGERSTPTVQVTTHPDLGVMLTDGEGMSLYRFTQDNEGESVCYDDCADAWPPLLAQDALVVPRGLPGRIGTTMRDGGSLQVTYNGMPLYYFVQDESPGDVNGQGVSDVWFVVRPSPAAGSMSMNY